MYKTLKVAAVTVLLGACLNSASAQTQKTITFGSSKSMGTGSKSKKDGHYTNYGKNSLSIGLLSWLDGFTAVTYERMLTESITVSGGLGITHKNHMMQLGDELSAKNPGAASTNHDAVDRYDIEDEYGNFANRKPATGIYASFSPRFYPRHESMDGGFVAPLIEYRNYRFIAYKADDRTSDQYAQTSEDRVPRSAEKFSETVRCIDLSAVWGGHYQLGGHVALGYYAGFGLRSMKATRLDLGYEQVGQREFRYTNDAVTYNDTRWIAQVGFSIGGWW